MVAKIPWASDTMCFDASLVECQFVDDVQKELEGRYLRTRGFNRRVWLPVLARPLLFPNSYNFDLWPKSIT
jgi:hypothetical protein